MDRKLMQAIQLQEWAGINEPNEKLLYKDGYWDQIKFVRDRIPSVLAASFEEFKKIQSRIQVISTHCSKSVLLPVYKIELDDGSIFIMRDNFYDWKVSISSPQEINIDFMGLFDLNNHISSCYCEGFPEEYVYGSYMENKRQFTIEIDSHHNLYVFFWLLAHQNKEVSKE